MLGDAIGPHRGSQRTGRGGDLHLWTAVTYSFHDPLLTAYPHSVVHVCLIGRDGTELVQTMALENPDEREGAIWER